MEKELREHAFSNLVFIRYKNISLLESISQEQSLLIPDKFSNNLLWQAGHILTTQISLIYRRSNIVMPIIDEKYLGYFAKGSSPANFDSETPTFERLLTELKESITVLEKDLHFYADKQYDEPAHVSFGMTLNSFHDAVLAIGYHETYHMQAINLLIKELK